jgi:AraC-like DNA-binding protein
MAVIATLLPNGAQLQRVRTAVRDRHELVACSTWGDLREACESRPIRLVIADLFATGNAAFDGVRVIKRRWPRVTFIMYSTISPDRVHDAFDAGRQGVDVLVVADQDDTPRALLAHIEQAEARSLTAVLRESLQGVDELVQDAVLLSVSRAHERLSPDGLAKLLALPRRTVSFRLEQAGFPSPRRLLTWGRLIMAANLMEDPNRAADRVSASLGFPSASAFRNMCQRYLHSTPSEIRRRGGAVYAVRALLRHVRPKNHRSAGAERPASRAPAFTI